MRILFVLSCCGTAAYDVSAKKPLNKISVEHILACLCQFFLDFSQFFLQILNSDSVDFLKQLHSLSQTLYLRVIDREAVDGIEDEDDAECDVCDSLVVVTLQELV